ncbi:MAG: GNAT family protein [Ferruginibacter sp.]
MENLFHHEIVLENKRARLEPLHIEHIPHLWPIAVHPSLWEHTSAKINSTKDFTAYIQKALDEKDSGLSYPFAVYDKQSQCFAGSTRFGNICLPHRRVEIGWTWYHPSLQRSGLNRSCKGLLLEFGFEKMGFDRIEFKTSLTNTRSQTAIQQLGATQEGILRNHMINDDGNSRDTVYFSILNNEWPSIKITKFNQDDVHNI